MPSTSSRSEKRTGYSKDYVVSYRNHGVPCSYAPHSNTYDIMYVKSPDVESGFEIITPNSTGFKQEWKDFEHYKRVLGDNPPACGVRLGIGSYDVNHRYYQIIEDPFMGQNDYATSGGGPNLFGAPGIWASSPDLPALYVPTETGSFIPAPPNLNELKQMSLNVMLPRIKAELSLINSIIELKDFRSLGRQLTSIKGTINRLRSVRTLFTGKTLKQSIRELAGGYLQAQFNIMPLLSDISSVFAALSRTERRMNDLVTRAGRPQNKHFAYKWQELPSSTQDNVESGTCRFRYKKYPVMNQFTYTFTSYLRRFTYSEPTTFHAQVQYNYSYTTYQTEHARLLSYLDAFGINLNPAIIWNAIPWSFVVDWVFGVSRWLNQFAIGNMEPKINIRRYLWSVKRARRILVEHRVPDTYVVPTSPGQWIPYPVVYESSYRRKVELPNASSIILSGLSSKEFSLGAALVLARRRR